MKNISRFVAATALALPLAVGTTLSAQAESASFILRNSSGYTLSRFYASPTYLSSWEYDILGSNVLPSGRDVRVRINDGRSTCWYDFMSVFSDGEKVVKRQINICKLGRYTIN
jgi:hypothetical protein